MSAALPNLLVIGAQKCGTSALHHYLSLHPEVSMSQPKELNFFIAERNWERGREWYESHFDPAAAVRGESSPNYSAHPVFGGVPARVASLVPDARLIYIVRDPLQRIAAHYVHSVSKRREKADLRSTLLSPDSTYVPRSRYFLQLERFLEHFPRERILVLEQRDLRDQRAATLREVFAFLDVASDFEHPDFHQTRHVTSRKTRPTDLGLSVARARASTAGRLVPRFLWRGLRHLLPLDEAIEKPTQIGEALGDEAISLLRKDADRLREFCGRDFAHWSL